MDTQGIKFADHKKVLANHHRSIFIFFLLYMVVHLTQLKQIYFQD
jgi:hypothetical protein